MSSPTLLELIAVDQVAKDEYVSKHVPDTMGNILPIGYGGCTTAVAVHSACQSVDKGFHIFSMLGSFHGPTKVDRKIKCRVFRTRQTRTFASRRVVVYQTQDNGSDRNCAEIFVDFHTVENGMYEYSTPPSKEYRTQPQDPLKTASSHDIVRRLVEGGHVSPVMADAYTKNYAKMEDFFEFRLCLDSVSGQNGFALAKKLVTTQDHLPIYEKTSAEWIRARKPPQTEAEHVAALTFFLDGGLSFLPLFHDHKSAFDSGPASTLDFALRILTPELKTDSWLLRERKTIAAHSAKTYSESRVWNESGSMVAVMTQTSICRPPIKRNKTRTKL